MVRRQPLAVAVTAIAALFLVLLGGLWTQSDAPSTDAKQPRSEIISNEAPPIDLSQPCTECHGPEFEFTGSESAIDAHGAVHEDRGADESGDRKPP